MKAVRNITADDPAVKAVRARLAERRYKFVEKVNGEKYEFVLTNDFGSQIYIEVWVAKDGYNVLVTEFYPSCRSNIMLTIGDRYVTTWGYAYGSTDGVSAEVAAERIDHSIAYSERYHKIDRI